MAFVDERGVTVRNESLANRMPPASLFAPEGNFTKGGGAMGMNRNGVAALALAALALTGCGKADDGPKTVEQAQQEATKLDRPEPGQYSQTMEVVKFEMPGAPPEMAKQMQTALGQRQNSVFCLTDKMAEEGFQNMFREIGKDGQCKYQRFSVAGGKLDAELACQSATEGKGTIKLAGTVGADGSDVTVEVDTTNPASPMGHTVIGMHLVSKRIGDCPAQ